MKKYTNWYRLLLKGYLRRASTWIQLLGMVLILLTLSGMRLPKADTLKAGIVNAGGEYGERIAHRLLTEESIFQFSLYEDEETLKKDVLNGSLECGFIFHPELDGRIRKGDCRRIIHYLATPFSVEGEVARETVYARFFEVYSEEMLRQKDKELFERKDSARTEELVRLKRDYGESEAVFSMDIFHIERENKGEERKASDQVNPLRGIAGLLVFFLMFMAEGRRFWLRTERIDRWLTPGDRFFFGIMEKLAAGTLPALAVWGILIFLGESRGWIMEAGRLALLVFLGSLWSQAAGRLIRRETAFVAASFSLMLVQLLLCPIFVDLSAVFPAIGVIRMIIPVNIYLLL